MPVRLAQRRHSNDDRSQQQAVRATVSGYGMVGGGQGAFIGAVHRIAARMDDDYELVAGALSGGSRARQGLRGRDRTADERAYGSFARWSSAKRRGSDRIEAVAIVTPNHMHFPVAEMAFLKAGIHVICDKPLTTTSAEASALAELAEGDGPRVRRHPQLHRLSDGAAGARHGGARRDRRHPRRAGRVSAGLARPTCSRRPARSRRPGAPIRHASGAGGCIGDIGTHAFNLACFVTGLGRQPCWPTFPPSSPGRKLDDNVHMLLRFEGGARGMLWASQVAPGNENGLRLRVYGDQGRARMGAGGPELPVVHAATASRSG